MSLAKALIGNTSKITLAEAFSAPHEEALEKIQNLCEERLEGYKKEYLELIERKIHLYFELWKSESDIKNLSNSLRENPNLDLEEWETAYQKKKPWELKQNNIRNELDLLNAVYKTSFPNETDALDIDEYYTGVALFIVKSSKSSQDWHLSALACGSEMISYMFKTEKVLVELYKVEALKYGTKIFNQRKALKKNNHQRTAEANVFRKWVHSQADKHLIKKTEKQNIASFIHREAIKDRPKIQKRTIYRHLESHSSNLWYPKKKK